MRSRAATFALAALWRCALPAVLLGCSAASDAPLTRYAPLHCRELEAVHREHAPSAPRSVAAGLDPSLGWERELGASCDGAAGKGDWCRTLSAYAATQERPLTVLDVELAYRGWYRHSLGVTVIVRAFRAAGQAHLVAKVLERDGGP